MARPCRFDRYLTAYADGELSERLRRRVEKHLASCEACARELDSIVASDRILRHASPPPVSEARWRIFRSELTRSLDRIDRESVVPAPRRWSAPVQVRERRLAYAAAWALAVVALAVVVLGPAGRSLMRPWGGAGNECMVDSIESYASGYTPMFFTSDDPEMTVIWVFAEEVEESQGDSRLGAP
jgi:anti-sigma factor RsiW